MARPKKQNKWDFLAEFCGAIIGTVIHGILVGVGFCIALKYLWQYNTTNELWGSYAVVMS